VHFRNCSRCFSSLLFALCCLVSRSSTAGGAQGEVVQTDSVGIGLLTRDLDAKKTTTVADAANINEYFGIHYYFVERVRMGMVFQWSQRIAPEPPEGESRFQRLAFLPQIGWNFVDPFYVTAIYGIAPYTRGQSRLDMTVEGALGASFPLSDSVRLSFSAVVPYAFYAQRSIGLTAVTGLGFRL
jgi:hypothetical protein